MSKRKDLIALLTRSLVWLGFFVILFVLRSFFLLIFLTFVFAYVQSQAVERLEKLIRPRTPRVILVGLVLLGVVISLVALIAPRVAEQTKLFGERMPQYIERVDLEVMKVTQKFPALAEIVPQSSIENGKYSPTEDALHQLLNLNNGSEKSSIKGAILAAKDIGVSALGITSAFFLSLLFSFLIVLDLKNLTEAAQSLRNTKVRFIYDEVADSIKNFCGVLGRALEAQLIIAALNTAFTAVGLVILGVTEKMAFILLIVFLCSFIPVAGVFISSVPICLLALQQSGFGLMFSVIIMITVIHLIEGYILNPKVYGHHMRMNPVIVLMILTFGGKLFGVWGLVLGVPVCTYIFGHAIRYGQPTSSKNPPL